LRIKKILNEKKKKKDSTRFYRCAHGFQYSFRCGPGQLYFGNGECNYPYAAKGSKTHVTMAAITSTTIELTTTTTEMITTTPVIQTTSLKRKSLCKYVK
jgi:hypothetical protein